MLSELSEIKFKRKQLDLTQQELAKIACVSQSLVAKIEAGSLIPSYNNAKKLFDALDSLNERIQVKAKDIMYKRIIKISGEKCLKDAARLMKKHGISQLPVIEKERVIGTISEKAILDKMHDSNYEADLSKLNVKEVMGEAMPIIQENSPFTVISPLLEHHPAVLVSKKGKIQGIITKTDLLNLI